MVDRKIRLEFCEAIQRNDVDSLNAIVANCPEVLSAPSGNGNWVHTAASHSSVEVVRWLVEQHGQDPHLKESEFPKEAPLARAMVFENFPVARYLLEQGADANYHMSVISPVNGRKKQPLESIKLLEEFGADLNRQYIFEQTGFPITALSMARDNKLDDVVDYLESRGCKMPTAT